ncbi:hypothetical protein [Kineococcus sp. R86509]|uniref:hypothetical protein n=1 Tax=Kineococcus sp. R86509 TaxID=3093851 RepID=UPI0036D2DFC7
MSGDSRETRWTLDPDPSRDDLHRLVAELRPSARAYLPRSVPLALNRPLVDLFPFVPPQFVTARLGRLSVLFRDLLPAGATWIHALDEPGGRWRVQILGLADGMVPARTSLAGFVPAGGVVVTLRQGHDVEPWEPGLVTDPADGDRVTLLVRGLPTFVALPDARTTFLGCRAAFHGTPVTVTVESTAWPEVLLLQLLHATDLQ